MEEEHHFTNVPYNYPLCLNRQCPKASTCLRQLVEQEVPDSAEYWVIISPKYQAKLKGACPHYRSSQKVQYAKGCMNILDNLPHKQRQLAIIHLMEYFSRKSHPSLNLEASPNETCARAGQATRKAATRTASVRAFFMGL